MVGGKGLTYLFSPSFYLDFYMKKFLQLLLIFSCLGASDCSTPAMIDKTANAASMGDATAFMSGCGSTPIPGYVYCRKKEGAITSVDKVTFYGPKGTCDRDNCTFITIYFRTGEPRLSLAIPKDKTYVSATFKQLTRRDRFEKFDRGYWPVLMKTYWIDDDDDERETVQEGEIRLRVYGTGYAPLHEIRNNPNFGWGWKLNGRVFKLTTAGRAYTGAVD